MKSWKEKKNWIGSRQQPDTRYANKTPLRHNELHNEEVPVSFCTQPRTITPLAERAVGVRGNNRGRNENIRRQNGRIKLQRDTGEIKEIEKIRERINGG